MALEIFPGRARFPAISMPLLRSRSNMDSVKARTNPMPIYLPSPDGDGHRWEDQSSNDSPLLVRLQHPAWTTMWSGADGACLPRRSSGLERKPTRRGPLHPTYHEAHAPKGKQESKIHCCHSAWLFPSRCALGPLLRHFTDDRRAQPSRAMDDLALLSRSQ